MEELTRTYITTTEVANILRINPKSAGFLARKGKIPAVKIANRWLIPKAAVEELAKTYVPRRGRPRSKRKYTRRRQT
ncbi:MAG: helix-turn-helix domain-containing protein [Chloroflexi bacterium]|nr:helix-turn-helix domain-containing protein [Chloroflexota bacterium]